MSNKKYTCHNCTTEFELQPNQDESAKFCSPFCCGSHWEKRQGVGKVSGNEILDDGVVIINGRVQS